MPLTQINSNVLNISDISVALAQEPVVNGIKYYIDTHITPKANLVSPEFIGVPTTPTAPFGTSNLQIANTMFVNSVVNTAIINNTSNLINIWMYG